VRYRNIFNETLKYLPKLNYTEFRLIHRAYWQAQHQLVLQNFTLGSCNVIDILGIYRITPKVKSIESLHTRRLQVSFTTKLTKFADKAFNIQRLGIGKMVVNNVVKYVYPSEVINKIKLWYSFLHILKSNQQSYNSILKYKELNLYNLDYQLITSITLIDFCNILKVDIYKVYTDLKLNIHILNSEGKRKIKPVGKYYIIPKEYSTTQISMKSRRLKDTELIKFKNKLYLKQELKCVTHYNYGLF